LKVPIMINMQQNRQNIKTKVIIVQQFSDFLCYKTKLTFEKNSSKHGGEEKFLEEFFA
jgi:very-short-patch-repair endonuclease